MTSIARRPPLPSQLIHANSAKFFRTILAAFCGGLFMGGWLYHLSITSSRNMTKTLFRITDPSSSDKVVVSSLKDTPYRNTSHVDQKGQPIVKQQLLEPFVLPAFVGFSVATFKPGQTLKSHAHDTLHELFFVLEGSAQFFNGDDEFSVAKGALISVPPKQSHGLVVPEESEESLKMAVFGVVIE